MSFVCWKCAEGSWKLSSVCLSCFGTLKISEMLEAMCHVMFCMLEVRERWTLFSGSVRLWHFSVCDSLLFAFKHRRNLRLGPLICEMSGSVHFEDLSYPLEVSLTHHQDSNGNHGPNGLSSFRGLLRSVCQFRQRPDLTAFSWIPIQHSPA